MKNKEEIEQLAKQLCNIPIDLVIDEEERYYKNFQKYDGIILGYTQCQEDMTDNAIRFAEWINKNDYEKIHYNRWCKKFMSYTHSTGELYQIYIESL